MRKLTLSAAACLLLSFVAGQAQATDVVGNGGFETEGFDGPTSSDLWTPVAGGAAGTFSAREATTPFAGQFAQHIVAIGTDAMGATAGIVQNTFVSTGPVSLEPGTGVTLSFQSRGQMGPGGVGFYALRILNSAGAIVANTGLQVFIPGATYAPYQTVALTVPAFGEAPNDAYYAMVEIVVAAGAFVGSTAEAFIDQVVVDGTLTEGGRCIADFNEDGGVDGSDVEAFFLAWEAGETSADVNADGGIDGGDVETFFIAWESGSC